MNNPKKIAERPAQIIGTQKLDAWLHEREMTGQDIPDECWGLANSECEENETYQALLDVRKNLQSKKQEYSADYRRIQNSILDIWCPIFERIAIESLESMLLEQTKEDLKTANDYIPFDI